MTPPKPKQDLIYSKPQFNRRLIHTDRRALKAAHMTIAAGFRCTDGVALCTDSEYTDGNSKRCGKKIYSAHPRNGFVYLAGAGDIGLVSSISDELRGEVGDKDISVDQLKTAVERVVPLYYDAHIARLRNSNVDAAGVDLLLATRLDGNAELYRVSETGNISKTPSDAPECIGMDTGKSVMRALSSIFFSEGITPIYSIPAIATHLIIAAGRNSAYCGGAPQIVCLSNAGELWEHIYPSSDPGESPLSTMFLHLPYLLNGISERDDEMLEFFISAMAESIRGIRDSRIRKSQAKWLKKDLVKWAW